MVSRPLETVAFIGLGVMGEPMCRNMLEKLGQTPARRLIAYDMSSEPLARLEKAGAVRANSICEAVDEADAVFLSLPGGPQVEAVLTGEDGVIAAAREGTVVVDTSTTQVELTRALAQRLEAAGFKMVDAPVARTRQAAEAGTLAISVGGEPDVVEAVMPFLRTMASDIAVCGGHGNGQMVKILNNMVLFQTVLALSEALAVARRAGMEGETLFDALANGSADSFALRNHGRKALLPGEYPPRAFPVDYAAKDLAYALELAQGVGLDLAGAKNVERAFEAAREKGLGDRYWPAIYQTVDV